MFHNKKYPKDKKYGDTLALKNIWGHFANKKYMGQIANTKYMGTDCHQYKINGDRLQIKIHGDPFPILFTKIYIHTTLGSSPGSLVSNRNMFLNIPLIANWHAITHNQEHLIHENLLSENQKRRRYDYVICT